MGCGPISGSLLFKLSHQVLVSLIFPHPCFDFLKQRRSFYLPRERICFICAQQNVVTHAIIKISPLMSDLCADVLCPQVLGGFFGCIILSTSNINLVSTSSSLKETSVPSKASHLDKSYFKCLLILEYTYNTWKSSSLPDLAPESWLSRLTGRDTAPAGCEDEEGSWRRTSSGEKAWQKLLRFWR